MLYSTFVYGMTSDYLKSHCIILCYIALYVVLYYMILCFTIFYYIDSIISHQVNHIVSIMSHHIIVYCDGMERGS